MSSPTDNENLSSLSVQPSGVHLITTEHYFNPHTGYYEPVSKSVPGFVCVPVLAAPGTPLRAVPATVNAMHVYHITLADAGAGDVVTITDAAANLYWVGFAPAPGNLVVVSSPEAPIFTVPGGTVLVAVGVAGTSMISMSWVDK